MMITDFELAELLQSRIFHDLSGPIGAMSNGAEFLREGRNDVVQKAIDLIEMSSHQAVAKIQYFKLAYGFMPVNGEANIAKIQNIVTNYFKNAKTVIEWKFKSPQEQTKISNGAAKIFMVLLLITNNMLIYGGNTTVELNLVGDNLSFNVSGSSANGIKIDRDTVQILAEKNFDIIFNSYNVQSAYVTRLCQNQNVDLKMDFSANEVNFSGNLKLNIKNTEDNLTFDAL